MDFSQEFTDFKQALNLSIQKHGDKPYNSPHEGLGVCYEEWHELTMAIHKGSLEDIAQEAMDLAGAAFWIYVSIKKRLENKC